MVSEKSLRIAITGRDETGNAVKSVTQSLKELKTAVREGKEDLTKERQAYADSLTVLRQRVREERTLRMEFRENHQTMFKTIETFRNFGNMALQVNQLLVTHNLLQMRSRDIKEELREATAKLIDMEAAGMKGTIEYQNQQKLLNKIKEEEVGVNRDSIIQYGVMTVGLAGIGSQLLKNVANLKAWNDARKLGSDPLPNQDGKGSSTSPYKQSDIDDFVNRYKPNGSNAIDYAKVMTEYNKFYNSPVKNFSGGSSGAATVDPIIEASRTGKFANLGGRTAGAFNRAGGNEIAAIASIVAPIALASPEFDRWMEENLRVNISRANEDRMIFQQGIPDGMSIQDFYNEYDRTGGHMEFNITVNAVDSSKGKEIADAIKDEMSKDAQAWYNAGGFR